MSINKIFLYFLSNILIYLAEFFISSFIFFSFCYLKLLLAHIESFSPVYLTQLHSEMPKLYTILAFLSAIGLKIILNSALFHHCFILVETYFIQVMSSVCHGMKIYSCKTLVASVDMSIACIE